MRINSSCSFARDHRAYHVADGERLRSSGFGFALGGDGVGGFSRLRNHHRNGVGGHDGIAVAPLARVIHFDRNTRQTLDHELTRLPGVPTGSASLDVDFLRGFEFRIRDLHFAEEDVAGLLRNAAHGGVAHRPGLLVNLFQHEMLEPTLLRLNWIPGDVLDLAGDGVSDEVGELHAFGGYYCEIAIAEKK